MALIKRDSQKIKKGSKKIISELKERKESNDKDKEDSLIENIDLDKEIKSVNLRILVDTENQKIVLRDKLAFSIRCIIWFQIAFFNVVVLAIVLSVISNFGFFKDINLELSVQLFEFLKYYIGATIVELLGMLVFILHYVFSDFRFSEPIKSKVQEKLKSNKWINNEKEK